MCRTRAQSEEEGMRLALKCILITGGLCALIGHAGGEPTVATKNISPTSDALPPLVVGENAPLLQEESKTNSPPAGVLKGQRSVADNSACYVCHVNFKDDPFVQQHARATIGCTKCHGDSRAHVADEANLTPPDVMFPTERITPFCTNCHLTHDAPAVAVIARWQERCANKSTPQQVLCTDCHGTHHMKHRAIQWDKRTRQLTRRAQTNQ